jgi:multiple sugar transport system permease protein
MASPGVLALVVLTAFPLTYLVYNTFFSVNRFTPDVPPRFVGLQNYVHVLHEPYVLRAFVNTIAVVAVSVTIELVLGLAVALLLYQPLRGQGVIRALLVSPLMIAPVVAGLQWRWLMTDQYGVINAILHKLHLPAPLWLADPHVALGSIILVDVWHTFPFVMLVLVAGLAGVPEDLLESAAVDGAGYWRRLWSIILPSLRPIILVIVLIRVMDTFRVFDTIYVLTGGGPGVSTESISTYSYRLAFADLDFESAGAVSVLAVLLVAALSIGIVRILGDREEKQP